ncbi:sulfatase [Flavobacterium sp. TMP13]|uniref:sulfatase n=1 Tax=Flavobacterium sp. TMP13 TaxID=3425950 RepID=UPI003D77D407
MVRTVKTLGGICCMISLVLGCKTTNHKEIVSTKKPNVIFILADDYGVNDLSFSGSKYYETPNIDQLAKEGVVFTSGYAACQVCSPSRASIMLGQSTARHGITDWIGATSGTNWRVQGNNDKVIPADYKHGLSSTDVTIAEAMRAGGYKTFFAGKWHLGNGDSTPENNGFDINKGGWEVGSPAGGYYGPWENPKLPYKYKGENLSMRLAQETADFISDNKNKPFFAFLSFYAVHGPIETTQEKWSKYRDKAEKLGIADSGYKMEHVLPIRVEQDNPIYAGLVETMDDAVGLLMKRLKELNLDKNTIVIFTSDNGGVASGDSFSTSNYPLRGGKGYQWEGGIREPYFIKLPAMQNAPKTVSFPVSGIDFYPTILELAGLKSKPIQKIDGISLVPLLKGKTITSRPLFWHYPHYGNQGGEPVSSIRLEEWKLIHYWEDSRDELYNLVNDPAEKKDVYRENTKVGQELRAKLDTFLAETNAKIPKADPNYDSVLAQKQYETRENTMLPELERQRKAILNKDFVPNKDWWNSKATND